MREDDDEIVTVEEDKRPWWKDRYITMDWRIMVSSGLIAAISAIAHLAKQH